MISTIFRAIRETLESTLRAAGEELPRHELGAFALTSTSAPPQIVWVIRGGQVVAPRQTGQGQNAASVRQIATRNERIDVHVWARDFDATERLMNHFVAAARSACTAYSFEPLATDWSIGQDQGTVAGRVCVLTIEVRVPFTAEPIGVSHAPHTVTVTPTVNPPS